MHSTACLRCHRRKVRCDRSLPQCSPCARAKVTCQYTTSEHQHRRQHLQRLEQRIRQLETDNNSLAAQLRSSQDRPVANSDPQPAVTPQHEENIGARDDGVAEQVVHASLVAGGGHHFVGSTSGLLLATLLQSGHSSSSVFPIPTQQAGGGPEQSRHSPYTDSNRPPKGLARDLLQAYRAHDHLCYPYISTKTLFQCLDSVYDGNNDDPVEAFFVDMALAIGTAQAHRLKWNGIYDSEAHLHRAMTRLTDVLARGGVQRLQALLLICQYKMGSTSSSTTPSVWHLIGVAARTCLEMGLHRASTYSLPVVPTGSTNENYDTTLQARREEMETKKKCFWSLVALDRVVSLALGRPFAIQLEDIDIDLSDGLPIDNQQETCSPAALSEYSRQDQIKTSAFVYIVRYRLICGKISNALHRASRVKGDSVNLLEARDSLATELQEWYSGTAKLPLSPGIIKHSMSF